MVLRTALEQVRRTHYATTSELAEFADHVEQWINGDDSFENAILDFLRTHNHIDEYPAYCEEQSREHDLCHVNFGRDGNRWLAIDRGGNIEQL